MEYLGKPTNKMAVTLWIGKHLVALLSGANEIVLVTRSIVVLGSVVSQYNMQITKTVNKPVYLPVSALKV